MNTIKIAFNGFYPIDGFNYYTKNGVRIHKPEFGKLWKDKTNYYGIWESNEWLKLDEEGKWTGNAGMKFAEIVDANGNVTDEFYGVENDFNAWVVAVASKGQKFGINLFEHGKRVPIVKLALNAFGGTWKLEKTDNGTWGNVTEGRYSKVCATVA